MFLLPMDWLDLRLPLTDHDGVAHASVPFVFAVIQLMAKVCRPQLGCLGVEVGPFFDLHVGRPLRFFFLAVPVQPVGCEQVRPSTGVADTLGARPRGHRNNFITTSPYFSDGDAKVSFSESSVEPGGKQREMNECHIPPTEPVPAGRKYHIDLWYRSHQASFLSHSPQWKEVSGKWRLKQQTAAGRTQGTAIQ